MDHTPTTAESLAWMAFAKCEGQDAAMFPKDSATDAIEYARSICFACTVRTECLDYALDRNERYGVWGGLTNDERQSLRRGARRRANAAAKAAETAPVSLVRTRKGFRRAVLVRLAPGTGYL